TRAGRHAAAIADADRAEGALEQHSPDAALDFVTRALAYEPTRVELWLLRARCWEKKNDLLHAAADLDGALELEPTNAEIHAQRAWLLHARHDDVRALDGALAALVLDPTLST